MPLTGKRLLVLAGDDYEDMELQYPKYRLLEAGAGVVVAGIEAGVTHHGKYGYPQKTDAAVRDLAADDFDGIVVPGGWMPDKLRRYEEVKQIVRDLDAQQKLIASICHGPWIDISAGAVTGVTYTSTPGIRDDLVNAGATWVDRPVAIDGHHVSSRRPDDLPDFCRGILEVMTQSAV